MRSTERQIKEDEVVPKKGANDLKAPERKMVRKSISCSSSMMHILAKNLGNERLMDGGLP